MLDRLHVTVKPQYPYQPQTTTECSRAWSYLTSPSD